MEAVGFLRVCIHCGSSVPEDRLKRMSVTCSNECAKADRRDARRFKHSIRKEQYQKPLLRRLAVKSPMRIAHNGASA